MPTASAPARLISPATYLVDGAGQHHLDHLDHRRVGHAQPVDEGGLDREPLQHGVDLRPAAMHHHRVDADLLQQRDVAAELLGQRLLTHRVAAVFHHDRRPRVAAQEWQRVRQDARLLGGGLEIGVGTRLPVMALPPARCGLARV